MQKGYDEELFNQIYKQTSQLRNSLIYSIDHRRLGITKDILKSWFDDKFIYVFNKYYGEKEPNILKGYIISSLMTFKKRVLIKAYEDNIYQNQVTIDSEYDLINIIPDSSEPTHDETVVGIIIDFMKNHLTTNAYELFRVELNPPPYLLQRLKNSNSKIPIPLLIEFFNLCNNQQTYNYIRKLRREIQEATYKARLQFMDMEFI